MKTVAVLSMLHQEAGCADSTTRVFRDEAVLGWTLKRLGVGETVVICWGDQVERVERIAALHGARVKSRGARARLANLDAVTVARRWSDGWRGGLMGACCFDLGFHAATFDEARRECGADAVLVIDPDAGLVDRALVGRVMEQAEAKDVEYCFSPAAPGASGVVIKASLLERLAACDGTLGKVMAYWPDVPGRDPISADNCAAVPTVVARTTRRLTLESSRQIELIGRATAELNGQLIRTGAEELLKRVAAVDEPGFPRDVVVEINTRRATRAVHTPSAQLAIERPAMEMETARRLFAELGGWDDVRVTLAGVGDPMLHEGVMELIAEARKSGVRAIHVETDFVGVSKEKVAALAASEVDVVTVHIPALTATTYSNVMGINALGEVLGNIKAFFDARAARGAARGTSTPLLVPTFTRLRQNMAEMEPWYDHWLRAVGCAVITGASDCAGMIADHSPVDMSPMGRVGCRRLSSRLTVLSDGSVTTCEVDVLGRQAVGNIREKPVQEMWQEGLGCVRKAHRDRMWTELTVCGRCRDWHRP